MLSRRVWNVELGEWTTEFQLETATDCKAYLARKAQSDPFPRPATSIIPALDEAVELAHQADETRKQSPDPVSCDTLTIKKPHHRNFTIVEIAALTAIGTVIAAPPFYPDLHNEFFKGVVRLQLNLRARIGQRMAEECRREEIEEDFEDAPGYH